MTVKIEQSWRELLQAEFDKPYFASLAARLHEEKDAGIRIYPPGGMIFRAFDLCPLDKLKVVIIGQDPYHGEGQAMGLSFSVPEHISAPPSLKNIFKEISSDLGISMSGKPDLSSWAEQGVLLLNTVLTVRAGQAHSHASLGWETFTDKVISLINQHREGVVFLLWGSHAQKKGAIIDKQRHHVLKAPHPSPLSAHRGFFGCNHFVLANQWLEQRGETPIDWMPVLPAESE